MAKDRQENFFYVVRRESTLGQIAFQLYGDGNEVSRRYFLQLNGEVPRAAGTLLPGQVLFIPHESCRDDEDAIRDTLLAVNHIVLTQLTAQDRQILAENPALTHNVTTEPSTFHTVVRIANTATNGLLGAANGQVRAIGQTLKGLEERYKQAFRAHGRLTPDFYEYRRGVYRTLDTNIGRVARTVALQSPLSESAKRTLKISTKRQVLHWERNGTGQGVRGFVDHYGKMSKVAKYLKGGGLVTVGVDTYLTADTIKRACDAGDDRTCHRTATVESAELAGSVGGGWLGGLAGYGVCSLAFGPPSAGSSFLWCAVVATPAGGIAGGKLTGSALGGLGGLIFDNTYSVIQ